MDGKLIYLLTRIACFHEVIELVFALSMTYLMAAMLMRFFLRNSSAETRKDLAPVATLLSRVRLASAICACSFAMVCSVPNRSDVKLMVVGRLVNQDGVRIHLENEK